MLGTLMAFFSMVVAASAGEVFLKNGSRLLGRIVSMEGGKLILETDFAGTLTLDWGQVEALRVDEPAFVVLSDGSNRTGVIQPAESSGQALLSSDSAGEPERLRFSDIASINPPQEPALRLNGRINVGLNKASGNTDTESGHVDAELIARAAKNRMTLGGAYNRASDDNQKTEDNLRGYLKHDYFLTEKLYWYLKGGVERDDFKDIDLRTTIGPGLGYQVFEGERMNLSFEAGPSYVYTDYDNAEVEDSISGRWAVKFDRFFFEKLFQYYFSNEGFVSASDTSDVFMFTKTGLQFPLYSGFFLNAGFEWDWDNMPAEEAEKSDYRYILSLGYGF
jgi:putative salt-induced outer membrane protein YdiY